VIILKHLLSARLQWLVNTDSILLCLRKYHHSVSWRLMQSEVAMMCVCIYHVKSFVWRWLPHYHAACTITGDSQCVQAHICGWQYSLPSLLARSWRRATHCWRKENMLTADLVKSTRRAYGILFLLEKCDDMVMQFWLTVPWRILLTTDGVRPR